MTEFDIQPNHQTDEGLRRGYELICNNDKKFKKCQTRPYDQAKLWDYWKNHWKEYTGPQFLFFECI